MEQLFKADRPNISLSGPVNKFLPLYHVGFDFHKVGARLGAICWSALLLFFFFDLLNFECLVRLWAMEQCIRDYRKLSP